VGLNCVLDRWLFDSPSDNNVDEVRRRWVRLITGCFVCNCNKENYVHCVVCTRQYRCLSSVENSSISLGDHSRVSGGCVEGKRCRSLFRVNH
jgi:hypothetical protein